MLVSIVFLSRDNSPLCLPSVKSLLSCFLSSRGFHCRLLPEQTAHWRERAHALQGLLEERQALCGWQDWLCGPGVHSFSPLVYGLEWHGCQPGWHCSGGNGSVRVCFSHGKCQYDHYGSTLDPVSLYCECRTALVSAHTHTHTHTCIHLAHVETVQSYYCNKIRLNYAILLEKNGLFLPHLQHFIDFYVEAHFLHLRTKLCFSKL